MSHQRPIDRSLGRDAGVPLQPGREPQLIQRRNIHRIAHRHDQTTIANIDRQHIVAPRHLSRHHRDDLTVDDDLAQIEQIESTLIGDHLGQLRVADHAEIDEHAPQHAAAITLNRQGALELSRLNQPLLDQNLAQRLANLLL